MCCLCLPAIIGTACGVEPLPGPPDSTVVLVGEDSAGAVVEIEKQGRELVRARVTDTVLGTGEAEVSLDGTDQVAFTIAFPAGVMISYVGTLAEIGSLGPQTIEGTWTQHGSGIFATDTGAWSVRLHLANP